MADIIRVGKIPGKLQQYVVNGNNTVNDLLDMASLGTLEDLDDKYEVTLYITHKTFDEIGRDRE